MVLWGPKVSFTGYLVPIFDSKSLFSAEEAEEIYGEDLKEYLGDKAKMFILVMRQLGKLNVKGSGQNVAYVVSWLKSAWIKFCRLD